MGELRTSHGDQPFWPLTMLQPWIFFVEGAITVVVAIVAFFFLPNTPGSASFLTKEEQWIAAHRLRIDLHGATSAEQVEDEKFSWAAVSQLHLTYCLTFG